MRSEWTTPVKVIIQLGSVVNKEKSRYFDLWPHLTLTWPVTNSAKLLYFKGQPCWEVFPGLSTTSGSEADKGQNSPPPLARRVWLNSPAGCGLIQAKPIKFHCALVRKLDLGVFFPSSGNERWQDTQTNAKCVLFAYLSYSINRRNFVFHCLCFAPMTQVGFFNMRVAGPHLEMDIWPWMIRCWNLQEIYAKCVGKGMQNTWRWSNASCPAQQGAGKGVVGVPAAVLVDAPGNPHLLAVCYAMQPAESPVALWLRPIMLSRSRSIYLLLFVRQPPADFIIV